MHDLVVRERQDEVLGEHVERRKRHQRVLPPAIDRIVADVVQHVVHPAHVPLVGEAEAAEMRRPAHRRECGRLFGRGQAAWMLGMGQHVQLTEEPDRLQVLPPAVLIRNPLPVPPRVVEIQHRCDRIDAKPVDVVLVQPEEGVRQQEVADLVAPIVEDQRAPVLVFALARVGMFVERGAVELRQSMFVLGEMPRHPVEDHRQPRLMTGVDEVLEVFRRTKAAGRSKEPEHLIAPRSRERMLHHRQQFEVGEAEALGVADQPIGQLAIGQRSIPFFGHMRPRAEVDLVDRHRALEPGVAGRPGLHPCAVAPRVAGDVADH